MRDESPGETVVSPGVALESVVPESEPKVEVSPPGLELDELDEHATTGRRNNRSEEAEKVRIPPLDILGS